MAMPSRLPTDLPAAGRARPATMAASDHRADDRQRLVSLSRDCIRIDRRLQGIAMRVAVPVRDYRGVSLSLATTDGDALRYRLDLVHRDADLSVMLDCAGDDIDILADWRLWSRFFRLPALVEREAGVVQEADLSLGGMLLGKAGPSRRPPRFRSKRRPAFLGRRKTGEPRSAAVTHAGECEMIARN